MHGAVFGTNRPGEDKQSQHDKAQLRAPLRSFLLPIQHLAFSPGRFIGTMHESSPLIAAKPCNFRCLAQSSDARELPDKVGMTMLIV
jgi:hypothetical protein